MRIEHLSGACLALLLPLSTSAQQGDGIAIEPEQPLYGETLSAALDRVRLAGCERPEDFAYQISEEIVADDDTNSGLLQRFIIRESSTAEISVSCDVLADELVDIELGPVELLDVEVVFRQVSQDQEVISEASKRFELPTLAVPALRGAPSPLEPLLLAAWLLCEDTTAVVETNRIIVENVGGDGCPLEPGTKRVGPLAPGDYQLITRSAFATGQGWTDVRTIRVPAALPKAVSGSWFNAAQPGHGLSLQVLPDGRLIGYWYVFDPEGNAAWIHLDGTTTLAEAGRVVIQADAFIVEGGRFLPNFDPEQAELVSWGTIELDFTACNRALMRFTPTLDGWLAGELEIEQLAAIDGVDCSSQDDG